MMATMSLHPLDPKHATLEALMTSARNVNDSVERSTIVRCTYVMRGHAEIALTDVGAGGDWTGSSHEGCSPEQGFTRHIH